jgi:hypothetical protein
MQIISKLTEIIVLRLMCTSCVVIFGIVLGIYTYIAYIQQDYEYSLIPIIIWFLVMMLWAWNATTIIVISYGIMYFSVYYLELRFKQLRNKLKYILEGRIGLLNSLMQDHNSLTLITHNYNKFFKYLMVTNQFTTTFGLNLIFLISLYGSGNIYFRLANAMVGIIYSSLMYLSTYTCANLSKEAHRFYIPINSLYSKSKIPSRIRWKVRPNLYEIS